MLRIAGHCMGTGWRGWLLLAGLLVLAGSSPADELEMLDGRLFKGKVIEETGDAIRFSIAVPGGGAEMRFRKAQVHALTVAGRRRVITEKPAAESPVEATRQGRPAKEAEPEKRDDAFYYVAPMKETHKKFTGKPGTFAHLGDSITFTKAFWSELRYSLKNVPPEMQKAFDLVKKWQARECWGDWKGSQFGNYSGMTIRWAFDNIDRWLKDMNPEVALIMFGTNDLTSVPIQEYEQKYREVAKKCLENGTILIITTIPPRHGMLEKSGQYAEVSRKIASDMKLPLIDYYAEILKRRPDDWDGALYDVPTLISRDGVHPSYPQQYANDFSEEGLRCNGYGLRSYLTVLKYAEVLETVLPQP